MMKRFYRKSSEVSRGTKYPLHVNYFRLFLERESSEAPQTASAGHFRGGVHTRGFVFNRPTGLDESVLSGTI